MHERRERQITNYQKYIIIYCSYYLVINYLNLNHIIYHMVSQSLTVILNIEYIYMYYIFNFNKLSNILLQMYNYFIL